MVLCSTSDADELTSHLSGHGLVDVQNENLICRRETTRRSILRRNVIRAEKPHYLHCHFTTAHIFFIYVLILFDKRCMFFLFVTKCIMAIYCIIISEIFRVRKGCNSWKDCEGLPRWSAMSLFWKPYMTPYYHVWKSMQVRYTLSRSHFVGLYVSKRLSLSRMCAFSYVWSLSFTWQRWRSHQSICHSRKRNPMLHANLMTLCFIEAELWLIEFLYCGNRDFRLFLLLWPWPWPDSLHIRTWPVFPRDTPDVQYQLPTSRLSKVIVWQTAKQTDTTKIIYLAASQVVNNLLEL